ncbi:ASCH domain-containing protein [Actinomycetes bacterium M1A6_2h]
MSTDDRLALLLSVKPPYAKAILSGEKTVELRRTRPSLTPGAVVIIYASSPMMAVVGWAKLERVIAVSPNYLWRTHGSTTGVNRQDFASYFAGATRAYGLQLSAPVLASSPMSLRELRELGVNPPQSWRYLKADLVEQIQRT